MAVYTKVTNEELSDFLSKYSIEEIIGFNGIKSGTSNSNYLLETEKRKLILTLFEERTNQENLPFFFDLMNHLNSANIKCPEVIKDQDNNFSNKLIKFNKTVIVLGLILSLQIVLGILTVTSGAQMFIASMHQISSILLVSFSVYFLFINTKKN